MIKIKTNLRQRTECLLLISLTKGCVIVRKFPKIPINAAKDLRILNVCALCLIDCI